MGTAKTLAWGVALVGGWWIGCSSSGMAELMATDLDLMHVERPTTIPTSNGTIQMVPGRQVILGVGSSNELALGWGKVAARTQSLVRVPLGQVDPEGNVQIFPDVPKFPRRGAIKSADVEEAERLTIRNGDAVPERAAETNLTRVS